ncbi:hypothetical protein PQR39_44525, partial [Paraburkholderia sediminicola]
VLRRGEADGPHRAQSKPHGFPGRPIRDARSAEWELMSPLSLTPKVRGHGFQMHHYRDCAGDPLSRGFEPLSFAYLFFAAGKEK